MLDAHHFLNIIWRNPEPFCVPLVCQLCSSSQKVREPNANQLSRLCRHLPSNRRLLQLSVQQRRKRHHRVAQQLLCIVRECRTHHLKHPNARSLQSNCEGFEHRCSEEFEVVLQGNRLSEERLEVQ